MNLLSRYKRQILLLLLIFFIGVISYAVYFYFLSLSITSTNPSLGSISYQTPFIKLGFNKEIKKDSIKLTSSVGNVNKWDVNKKILDIDFSKPFEINQDVIITLSAESIDGYRITNKILRFNTKDISSENLPNDQKKALKDKEQAKPSYYTDPILKFIPNSTLDYAITPNFISSKEYKGLQVDITLYLTNVDISTGRQAAMDKYLLEAKEYIKSKGLNIENYLYTVSINES